jgi:hypothetical protein
MLGKQVVPQFRSGPSRPGTPRFPGRRHRPGASPLAGSCPQPTQTPTSGSSLAIGIRILDAVPAAHRLGLAVAARRARRQMLDDR